MEFEKYIRVELLILIPVLYLIGIGLKKSKMPDKFIPLILGISSIILSSFWVIATCDISCAQDIANAFFTAITQGVLTAGASVYANQLYRQTKKEE
ncbi:MAG: hypothetical protein E7613_06790 [Ruminococcaceae bacterium]|nr:hypothetical protein [Oscillospiraceae bacterium]